MTLDPATWARTVRDLSSRDGLGKRVGQNLYLHASVLGRLPKGLRDAIEHAAERVALGDRDWNVVKLGFRAGERRVSFLCYPGFWHDATPSLWTSYTVDLDGFVSRGKVAHTPGTWILHRKELLLAPDDPRRAAFARLTEDFERRGLFAPENLRHIGHGPTWERLLRAKGKRSKRNDLHAPSACFSERTALRQVPALHKALVKHGEFAPGTLNADLGGGPYDDATRFLARHRVTNLVYDCQLDRARQRSALRRLRDAQSDTATVANVLNVIPDTDVRREVLELARSVLRPGGVAWVAVYEGDRAGKGRATPKGWQANRTLASYLREVQAVFPEASVVRVGGVAAIRGEKRSA